MDNSYFKNLIFGYWDNDITFPYEEFFDSFTRKLYEKLSLHGFLTLKDYIECVKKYYDFTLLEHFVYESKHTEKEFTLESILRCIFYPRYKHFRAFHRKNKGYFKLRKLYYRLRARNILSIEDYRTLVDDCIHAEHNSGGIIGLDMEELRKEYEQRRDYQVSIT